MRKLVALVMLTGGIALTGCVPPPTGPGPDTRYCEIERKTIETTLEAYRAESGGTYPDSLDDVMGVYFDPEDGYLEWAYESTGSTYTLHGVC